MKTNTYNNLKGTVILCLAALIWGLAFVAQSSAADRVPPFLFNGLRSLIGAAFLCMFNLIRTSPKKQPFLPQEPASRRSLLLGGAICGVLLTLSVNFQQFGITAYPEGAATEARGGFITALYVILVPIFSVFSGKKISPAVWIAVAVAMAGVYLLCLSGDFGRFYFADLLVFGCAISFTFHILAVDRFGAGADGALFSMMQFVVCGLLSMLLSVCTETANWSDVLSAAPEILYLGIMSSGIAYTLQIVGQKYAEPAIASISMSLESVFAALGGWIIMGNALTVTEISGCLLVFAAITLAQLPQMISSKKAPTDS